MTVTTPSTFEMRNISKRFPNVVALQNVSISAQPGEILGLLGENGAGKSTLVRILAGIWPAGSFEGDVFVNGQPVQFHETMDAERAGIVIIPQELLIIEDMTVGENLFLNREPARYGIIDIEGLHAKAVQLLERFVDLDVDPWTPMRHLSVAQQQLVEIARALSKDARILILDEPTSSLAQSETDALFERLRTLKTQGVAAVYISHRLDELFEIADRIIILRDGQVVANQPTSGFTPHKATILMLGREVDEMFPHEPRSQGDIVLEVRHLSIQDPSRLGRYLVHDANFSLRRGEVLGIFGSIGSGRSELAMGLFGWHHGRTEGDVLINGKRVNLNSPRSAIRHGLSLVTEDRRRYGLLLNTDVRANISITTLKELSRWSVISESHENELAQRYVDKLDIRVSSITAQIGHLSGGNQQKAIVARWLTTAPQVLILDEPTRGIDVGAKTEIFHLLDRLLRQRVGVVFISSEAPEVLGVSDRIIVMREGLIAAEFSKGEATRADLVNIATRATD